ncbi:N-acetylmuramoyl-L-alanine amidase [Pseudomonas sp. 5P_5.1_Bac1]|uniref:N-acetylmuramoyl-L-alanine amidase n=1 Tax=Pseudomonas sp. 5P_5.1_Bac1 TaxID=2971616 RepID=UPI0021CA982E|nr:N-acetylmuramoyl-L-alanine amidase [Pseudomonas sp. 5P_5.1_Bac1]MCU1724727.1 N-acetylmuramoyl-L-alanine amidase [Pseudomonas sp. 5P_5.1_Bac1]
MKAFFSLLLLAVLAGCSSGPQLRIDRSHVSANQDSRIQFVVLHYTNASLDRSLALLTHGEVSSHYLIGDDRDATIYQLVDESRRAWHAGDSQWEGRTWLNSTSIGIEIVNPGFTDTPTGRVWHPYSEAQIQSLIVLLKDIVQRNNIQPRHIIGHSDIAPLRKLDPGPLFPWKRLADAGLGIWPDARAVAQVQARFAVNPPSVTWYQQQLARFGYAIEQSGELDVATRHVLAAFQMRFRAQRFDGQPDAQTAAILQVLNNAR